MSDVVTFSCESCGKKYPWKAEQAGKRAKCKCGQLLTVPAEAPGAEPGLDDLMGLVPTEQEMQQQQAATVAVAGGACPSCGGAVGAGAVICVGCGFNLKTGGKLETRAETPRKATKSSKSSRKKGRDEYEGNPAVMDYYVRAAMAAIGLTLIGFVYSRGYLSFGTAIVAAGIAGIFDAFIVFIGCLLAVKLAGISLGSPGSAIIKVLALALAPSGLERIVAYYTGIEYVGWAAGYLLALFSLKPFFELDGSEVFLVSGLVYVLRMLAGWLVLALLITSVLGSGFHTSTPTRKTSKMEAEERKAKAHSEDFVAGRLLGTHEQIEAHEFLKGEKNAVLGIERDKLKSIVEDYYAKGATKVMIADVIKKDDKADELVGAAVVVFLPGDSKMRADLIAYQNKLEGRTLKPGKSEDDDDEDLSMLHDWGQNLMHYRVKGHPIEE